MNETETIWTFGNSVFTNGLFSFIIYAIVAYVIATIFVKILNKAIKKAIEVKGPKSSLSYGFLYQTIRTIIYALMVFAILHEIKMMQSVSTILLGASSVLAVIAGLAAQEAFGNLISGFFLTIHQPFQVGDVISLPEKGIMGTVTALTLRHTTLKTYENSVVIVPNSVMNSAIIEDKQTNVGDYCKYLDIAISYDSDVEKARKIILETITSHPSYIEVRTGDQMAQGADAVPVRVWAFQDSGVLLHFPIYCKSYGDSFQVCSDIRETLLKKFQENGITIPFPTRTIYTK